MYGMNGWNTMSTQVCIKRVLVSPDFLFQKHIVPGLFLFTLNAFLYFDNYALCTVVDIKKDKITNY